MAKKRQSFSFPELEGRGRGAILRTAEEVQAEQELLQSQQADAPGSTDPPAGAQESTAAAPRRSTERRPRPRAQALTSHSATDSRQPSEPDSGLASGLASNLDETVAAIRKVVRMPGREVSFVRLTPEEKAELADVVYTFKRQGRKTTENEVNRIAVNFILQDYRANGEQSILTRVLAALLA